MYAIRSYYAKDLQSEIGFFFLPEGLPESVLDVGDKLLTALGLRREDVIGRKCHEAFRGLPTVCENCDINPASPIPELCTRQSLPEEEKILGMAFKVYSAPIRDDEGKVWGFIEFV